MLAHSCLHRGGKILIYVNTDYHKVHVLNMLFFYRLVFEDNEHGLFTVTLFKKVLDEFKPKARDKK